PFLSRLRRPGLAAAFDAFVAISRPRSGIRRLFRSVAPCFPILSSGVMLFSYSSQNCHHGGDRGGRACPWAYKQDCERSGMARMVGETKRKHSGWIPASVRVYLITYHFAEGRPFVSLHSCFPPPDHLTTG